MSIHDYKRTAAANNAAPPAGAPEGWDGDDVNEWARELMSRIATRFWTTPDFLDLFRDSSKVLRSGLPKRSLERYILERNR